MNVSKNTKKSKTVFKCHRCGISIIRRSNAQKYCKNCSFVVGRYKSKLWKRRQRSIGTSNFFGHAKKNFEYEYFLIQQEKKRIGL